MVNRGGFFVEYGGVSFLRGRASGTAGDPIILARAHAKPLVVVALRKRVRTVGSS